MFDFFIRKSLIKNAQKYIHRLKPEVNAHIPKDLPLPSVGVIRKMSLTVSKINKLEEQIKKLTNDQLRAKTKEFKTRIHQATQRPLEEIRHIEEQYKVTDIAQDKEQFASEFEQLDKELKEVYQNSLAEILPEAFAVVREAAWRTVNMRHFDVQLIGGIVLHEGKIAEMATGEGKTLVATLPAYLNALTGCGVHVVTVNDYLARRDQEWMRPIYESLGLTVGVIQHDMSPQQRQVAYACDITYGTNNEFGFDYLRDNMVIESAEIVQPRHSFAIVDEVDSILVDEARTPLIISGPAEESTDKYYRANDIAKQLRGRRITEKEEIEAKYKGEDLSVGFDYVADEKAHSVSLSEAGEEKSARLFGVANLHDIETMEYRHHVLQSLRAKEFFKRDVDYVVRDGKVMIVDEFTGRMMPGRRWSDGLHQAVEAKEGIKIERENQTLATITFQNYFRMYDKLSGMTGTAYTEANEFKQIYNLDCVVIPTNRILQRTNHADAIYKTTREKYNAVVEEIVDLHKKGRPVLVGTISIEKSELIADLLKRRGIPHQVLNAKYHELEAQIVAQAGRFQAVTIATNMAGRGTDILLGGNAEYLAKNLLTEKSGEEDAQNQNEESFRKFLEQFKSQVNEEHAQVVDAGGLHVLGTERHESRRIDNQLRGRSGRQGDPGSSRFFVSLEDDLMRLFGSDRIMLIMDKLGMEEGQVIEHPLVSRALEVAQKRVEGHNFEIRKQLLEYDNVLNKQREVIYRLRRSVLENDGIREKILQAIEDLVHSMGTQYLTLKQGESDWDLEGLKIYCQTQFGFNLRMEKDELQAASEEDIRQKILDGLIKIYQDKEQSLSPERLREFEKMLLLQTIDSKWKDHLYAMDRLKEGIGLRALGQRDPLIEYQREGFSMFEMMYESINQEVAQMIFKIKTAESKERLKGVFTSLPQEFVHQDFSSLSAQREPSHPSGMTSQSRGQQGPVRAKPIQRSSDKVGRNDPCPCGSGKKYKKCCGK
ncbi:MAG: preprotein translocase subunit SecA [Candidatus Omnitrophota bacterium]